jgi:hypothetical protein
MNYKIDFFKAPLVKYLNSDWKIRSEFSTEIIETSFWLLFSTKKHNYYIQFKITCSLSVRSFINNYLFRWKPTQVKILIPRNEKWR